MKYPVDESNDAILASWYQFAGQQAGFVGSLLKLSREKQKKTIKQQQRDLGISDADFIRLQGLPIPRPTQFVKDTRRIAAVCNLSNPSVLVQEMLLAQSIERMSRNKTDNSFPATNSFSQSYQAAFDEDEDINTPPEEH